MPCRVTEEKKKSKEKTYLKKTKGLNFPIVGQETYIQVQKAQNQLVSNRKHKHKLVSNETSSKRFTPRHSIFKMAKIKERILKKPREKQPIKYKENPIRLSVHFSAENLQISRE